MSHADRTKIELEARKADVEEFTRLRAEVERLQRALKTISECGDCDEYHWCLDAIGIAREALAVGGDPE